MVLQRALIDAKFRSSAARMNTKALVAALMSVCICVIKYPHRLFNGFLWAEDGPIFILQASQSGLHAPWTPYNGYLHAVPRLIAGTWTVISTPEHFPHGFAWSCVGVYFVVSYGLFRVARRHFPTGWRGDVATFVIATLPFLVPQSGEIYFTITNLQWFLAPLLAFVVIDLSAGIDSPMLRWGAFLLAITGPFGVMLLPVTGALWVSQEPRRLRPLLPYLAGCGWQLVAYALTHSKQASLPLMNHSLPSAFASTAIGEVFVPFSVDLFRQNTISWLVVECSLLAIAVVNGPRVTRLSAALCVSAAALWMIGITRQGTPDMMIHWYGYGARYLLMPELCMGIALVFAWARGAFVFGRLAAIALLCAMVWKAPLPVVPHGDDTKVIKEGGTVMLRFPPGRDLQLP